MVLPRNLTGSSEVVWERLEPGASTPSDAHATFDQIFLILRGTGEVTIAGESSPVAPRDTVFIPQAHPHSVRCTSEEGLEYLYINVWRDGIPHSESDWRKVYAQIHDRRTVEEVHFPTRIRNR
jgi:quercetin dioxygenase-like cupin family protein